MEEFQLVDPSENVNGCSNGEARNVRWDVALEVLLRLLRSSLSAFVPPAQPRPPPAPSSGLVVEYE